MRKFLVNLLHSLLIVVPIVFGIYTDWNFTQINELILTLCIISFICGICILCFRFANCSDCHDEDCILSLYCELQTKIKRVKRLFIFLGYDKETVNNIATINYQGHNNYIDIIEITYKKLTEPEINYKGYND